ncbi:mechanosensitive ion channel family protein [Alteromonas facilis]|uniref:mechanosensitive ion channel family protein n=1 Tax=Alteromonas facilis TaxID=2048004 RepID=UPI000C2816F1|nr:mechanosensitive ion channel family protein [Alteromonas facilis]
MLKDVNLRDTLLQYVQQVFPSATIDSPAYLASTFLIIVAFALVSLWTTRFIVSDKVTRFVLKTKSEWDDELHQHHFFRRCGHLVPAIVISLVAQLLMAEDSRMLAIIEKLSMLYLSVTSLLIISALLNTIEDIYNASSLAKRAPITGFIQVAKLLFTMIVGILVISLLIDKSPIILLSGMTAIAAVLLLIFRDTILGFVAGIQIAANRMFNTGDWIAMPKYDVDGEILMIGLTNVKVQNWDKTISTLPTYSLTTEAVKNWRGMSESGGRRIKRSINIDLRSVKFCDEQMLHSFANIRFIKDYIADKVNALKTYHQDKQIDEQDVLNSRRLTNLGTFRAYLRSYIANHPDINKDMTMMVRQLAPTEVGLPLEIYCFSANKDWVAYEGIQADIFDHAIAMLPQFGLKAYQRDNVMQVRD